MTLSTPCPICTLPLTLDCETRSDDDRLARNEIVVEVSLSEDAKEHLRDHM